MASSCSSPQAWNDGEVDEPAPAPGLADLDDALLVQVARHLPLHDLCRASRACRRLHGVIAGAQDVWRVLYAATWPEDSSQQQQQQRRHQQQEQQLQQQPREQQQGGPPQGASAAAAARHAGSSSGGRPPDAAGPSAAPQPASGSKRRREEAAALQQLASPAARGAAANALTGGGSTAAAAGTAAAGPAGSLAVAAAADWRARFRARYTEEARRERAKRQARRMRVEDGVLSLRRQVHQLELALAREQHGLPALRGQLADAQRARAAAAAHHLAQRYWLPVAVQQAHGAGVVTDQEPQDAEAREHDLRQRLAVAELEVRKLTAALEARRRRLADAQRRLQALLP